MIINQIGIDNMKFRLDIDWDYIGICFDVMLLPNGHTEVSFDGIIRYFNDEYVECINMSGSAV